jgi:hypothetical protein
VEHLATEAARDPSLATGVLLWCPGSADAVPPPLDRDDVVAGARYEVGDNCRGRYLGLELTNLRRHQAGRYTLTLWLTELRTFRHSRRIPRPVPHLRGTITDTSNQREDKRVNGFRRHPDLALQEIERNGPRARLALDSLPTWLTGFASHPGGKRFMAYLSLHLEQATSQ